MRFSYRIPLSICFIITILEVLVHVRRFSVPRPSEPLDLPFQTQCQDPLKVSAAQRENAVIVMLARNSDIEGAASAILSLEKNFNRWFHYPMIFINDQKWNTAFMTRLKGIASGDVQFVTVGQSDWGYPAWIDQDSVLDSLPLQKERGSLHAEMESYHHMCRFQSGYDQNMKHVSKTLLT